MKRLIFFALVFAALSSLSYAQNRIPKGEIADHIQSAYDPNQTHCIYVPGNYTPEKKWPILFCYDARSRGKIPAELFREGAERLGWIIFSSNHSRSDDPNFSNLNVLNAMWSDAHKWFSLDEQRIYATGFSGGARLAWGMGYVYPKSTAGVIGVGGGIHAERPPSKDTTFVWYGMSGKLDFNYLEIRNLDEQLHSLGIPSRTEFFEGPHNWPPNSEYCSHAMDWMELQAMKSGRKAKDAAWIQQQYNSRLDTAKKLEASNVFEAYLKYVELQEDFSNLLDISDVTKKVVELSDSESVKKGLEERKKREDYESKHLEKYLKPLAGLRNGPEIPKISNLRSDLELSKLQKELEEKGNSPEGQMYSRLLESISIQLAFYLPQYFLEKKDSDRAIESLTLAAEIHNDDPFVWYNMALAHVQKGDKKKAIENLRMSVEHGLKNRKWIDDEKSFDVLKTDPQFQQVLAKIPDQN
jgi:dienelactone hydrolase